MNGEIYLDWNFIFNFMTDAFKAVGVPEADAKICADILVESDKKGIESHGVNRFKPIYIDRINAGIQNPVTNFEVVKETMPTAVVDGHDGMGMVISYKAMNMAIEKAKKCGMGMVAVRNSTHFGISGYYAEMATKQNLIGIIGTNARPSQAPQFGVEALIGTNPMTFGLPTDEDFPFLLDCATTITQRAAIEVWAREGKATPEGMVIDSKGNYMTDSKEILDALVKGEASLVPLGGPHVAYKGFGYATVIEILSSALQMGSYMKMLSGIGENGERQPHHLGHFFIAIDTEAFEGSENFKKTCGDILRSIRASKKAPGRDRIYTPGEMEYLKWLDRKDKGVRINESIEKELVEIRDRYKLDYVFPFEK